MYFCPTECVTARSVGFCFEGIADGYNRRNDMLRSMTGFGKGTASNERLSLTVELKSVNSKVLDLGGLRLPLRYRSQEALLRNEIAEGVERGKVDLQVSLSWLEGCEPLSTGLNGAQFAHVVNLLKASCEKEGLHCSDDVIFSAAMQSEGVWHKEDENADEQEFALLHQALLQAIDELNSFRIKEAEATARDFAEQLRVIRDAAAHVDAVKDARPEVFRLRFEEELARLKAKDAITVDEGRLAQELFYHIQRLDVNEELKRLAQHCLTFEESLDKEQSQGRKLNFIAQEMGREMNTLGSKACDQEIQHWVVVMKDALEKIKEQVLNIL